MTNPFHRAVDDALRMQPVRAVAQDGTIYEGILERRDHHSNDVLLRGAETVPSSRTGDRMDVGATWIQDPLRVEERNREELRMVATTALTPAPYHARMFDPRENTGYIQEVRRQGHVDSILLARPVSGGSSFELLEGHKRAWVAQEADLDRVAVEVVDYSDWQAAWHYAEDHLHQLDDGTLRQTLAAYAERWGAQAREIPVVDEAAQWADVTITDAGLQEREPDDLDENGEEDVDDGAAAAEDFLEGVQADEEDADAPAPEPESEPDPDPVDEDVVFIQDVSEIGSSIADRLRTHGFETAADIEAASVEELTEISYVGTERAEQVKTAVDNHDARSQDEATEAAADDDEDEDDEVIWCGICWAGPFEKAKSLNGHHNGAGHEGATQPVTTPPPDEDEDADDDEDAAPSMTVSTGSPDATPAWAPDEGGDGDADDVVVWEDWSPDEEGPPSFEEIPYVPDDLDVEDFEEAVAIDGVENIEDVAEVLGWTEHQRALREVLHKLGLYDDLPYPESHTSPGDYLGAPEVNDADD